MGDPRIHYRTLVDRLGVDLTGNGLLTCICGCGEESDRPFRPGHDQKLVSRALKAIRRGEVGIDQATEAIEIVISARLADKIREYWTD